MEDGSGTLPFGQGELAGNEMLASFLWAVGEDAMASSPPATQEGQGTAPTFPDDGVAAGAANVASESDGFSMAVNGVKTEDNPLPPGWDITAEQVAAAGSTLTLADQGQGDMARGFPATTAVELPTSAAANAAPAVPSASFNVPLLPPHAQPFGPLSSVFGAAAGMLPPACPGLGAAAAQAPLLPMGQLGLNAAFPALLGQLPLGGQLGQQANGDLAKNQQRLQKKAESARVARVRKKHYVATLELEVSELRAKVRALQNAAANNMNHNKASAEAGTDIDEKVQEMSDMLQRHSIDRLTSDVNNLVEQFVQNQRERQQSISYHFDEILDHLDIGPQVCAGRPSSRAPLPRGPLLPGPLPGRPRSTRLLSGTRSRHGNMRPRRRPASPRRHALAVTTTTLPWRAWQTPAPKRSHAGHRAWAPEVSSWTCSSTSSR